MYIICLGDENVINNKPFKIMSILSTTVVSWRAGKTK